MTLVVVPVTSYEGETATAFASSLGEYVEGQKGVTLDQLKAVSESCFDKPPSIDDLTPEERHVWLCEDVGLYTIDQLVVIDDKHLPKLRELSDKALDHGSDSAWYEACQWYNECVRNMGVKTIPFYNDEVIAVDPNY